MEGIAEAALVIALAAYKKVQKFTDAIIETNTLPTDEQKTKVIYHLQEDDGDYTAGYYVYDSGWKKLLNDTDNYSDLQTTDKTIIGAINELST